MVSPQSTVCVCMKEVEAVCPEQGVWDQDDDDGLTFGWHQLKDLQNMEIKKVLHFVPPGKFHRVTARVRRSYMAQPEPSGSNT